jgi:hypothetical protein
MRQITRQSASTVLSNHKHLNPPKIAIIQTCEDSYPPLENEAYCYYWLYSRQCTRLANGDVAKACARSRVSTFATAGPRCKPAVPQAQHLHCSLACIVEQPHWMRDQRDRYYLGQA